MKNLIVKAGATLTGALSDSVLTVAGVYGGDVKFNWNAINKVNFTAYSAGTPQVSTATIASTLTAGNVISFQLVQDLKKKNNVLPDEYLALISHTISATDTVTTIAASIVAQVNALPFEIVATNSAGVVTLTATAPYNVFTYAEVKDDGANLTLATGTAGVAPLGVTGAELVAMEVEGAVAGSNYDVFEFFYAAPFIGDNIVADGNQKIVLYVESTVSTTDLENSLKALDIANVALSTSDTYTDAAVNTAINAALAQVREYLAKLS